MSELNDAEGVAAACICTCEQGFNLEWRRQTRRDGRILMACFMGFFFLFLAGITALAFVASYSTGRSNAFTEEWWMLPSLPLGFYLLFEFCLYLDKLWVRYYFGETL